MTESESSSRIKISRSMIGRLAAVALFLCLGTLAVMHTVTNRKQTPIEPKAEESSQEAVAAAEKQPADEPGPAAASSNSSHKMTAGSGTFPNLNSSSSSNNSTAANLMRSPSSSPNGTSPTAQSNTLTPPSLQSGSATLPAGLASQSRPGESNRLPAINTSSSSPPPPMSFNANSSGESNTAAKSNNTPSILNAKIESPDDDKNPAGTRDGLSPPITSSNAAPPLGNARGVLDSPQNETQKLGQNSATNLPTDQKSSAIPSASNTGNSSNRISITATPYDAPSSSGVNQSLGDDSAKPPENSAGSFGDKPASTMSPLANRSAQSNQPLGSNATSNLNSANSSSIPTINVKPQSEPAPPIRSALSGSSTPNNPGPNTGLNSATSARDSLSSPSRSFNAAAPMSTPDAVRVQATPGGTNLEGPQVPTIKLQKIAPREVQINKPLELQLVVQNTGQVTAEQVTVYDRVPEGTELIDTTPKANQSADGTLSWILGAVAPGETSKITIQLLPKRPGEFGSVAQVTFAAQATARTLCTQPILSVKHSTKPKVLIGEEVILDITVENKGDGPATGVMLQETVPDLLTFADGSRELEFEIGTLAPNQKRSVQLRLKAANVGRTQNRIVAQGDAGLEASDAIELEVAAPQLQVTGEGPDRKYLNRQATHDFIVSNSGTAPATNVDLIARLPRGLKFVSANNHGQYDASSNAVYWSLQQLAVGQTGRVQLVTLPIESGDQKIDFEATADLNQKTAISKSLAVEYLVELFCEIDDLTDPIEIDGETAYRVKVVNQGLQAATNIRLSVDFPSGIQPISVSGNIPNQIQGQRVVFSAIDRLDAQQETVVTIAAKGTLEGDHRVVVSMSSDNREAQIAKEESTRVYSDRR